MLIEQIEKEFKELASASEFESYTVTRSGTGSVYKSLCLCLYKGKFEAGIKKHVTYTYLYYINKERDIPVDEIRPIKEIFEDVKGVHTRGKYGKHKRR